jgi:hypothetical protein
MIEFMMLIPLIMAFMWYIVHVNLAINKSIVGQKHARSQLFLKLYNHRSGPEASEFSRVPRSHFYLGVADDVFQQSSGRPKAPVQTMGIGPNPKPNSEANNDPGEPQPGQLRQQIRVRTVFGICTHRKRRPDGRATDYCGS